MKDQESNEDEDEGSRTITELFSSSDEDTDSENDKEIVNTVKRLDQIHAQKKIKGKRNRLKPHQTQKMINYFCSMRRFESDLSRENFAIVFFKDIPSF